VRTKGRKHRYLFWVFLGNHTLSPTLTMTLLAIRAAYRSTCANLSSNSMCAVLHSADLARIRSRAAPGICSGTVAASPCQFELYAYGALGSSTELVQLGAQFRNEGFPCRDSS
jgi:hypothetical protein